MSDEVAVFISYRRNDSGGHAGRLFDHLATRFGSDRIFMDVEGIEPGADFTETIASALDRCRAAMVVIGPHWLDERLFDANDVVRVEIETELSRGLLVLPVLVHGAKMPAPQEVPASLGPLTRPGWPASEPPSPLLEPTPATSWRRNGSSRPWRPTNSQEYLAT